MKETNSATLKMALCEGRHEIPQAIDGAIFPGAIDDVTKVNFLEEMAFGGIWYPAFRHYHDGEAGFLTSAGSDFEFELRLEKGLHLDLYVTGLTVALIAALNVCRQNGVSVTLWHYDKESGSYYPQAVK